VTTPPSRLPRPWNGEGEVLGVVSLLRAEGGEKESQFGLVALEDGRPTEAETTFGAYILYQFDKWKGGARASTLD